MLIKCVIEWKLILSEQGQKVIQNNQGKFVFEQKEKLLKY